MKLKTVLLASLALSSFAHAQSDIVPHHAYARATPPTVTTSAMFGEFVNSSQTERYIVAASSDAAQKIELHDVIKEGDIMKMRQVKQFKIPAQGKVVLKPGSLHIMLFNLTQPLVEGKNIDVDIMYANGDKQTITVPIKKVATGMKHHKH